MKRSKRSSSTEASKISSEADKLLKELFDYARRRRNEGVYDFTQIMHEYSKYVLPEFLENSKNALGKRLNLMIREYVATDPRYQSKLDGYGIMQ
jgi:hypothetical protein